MSITAKLALSQLKINRARTVGALTAIALSAALVMAVCSFVASGNDMLVRLLGESYGNYGGAYVGMLLIPAILFGILILSMTVIVISNVFRASAGERTAQFGILKCVGATERQISRSVMCESVLLSAIGIPAGLALGLLLTWAGIGVVNHYLSDLNSLVNVMMVHVDLDLRFVLSWQALGLTAAICFVTVAYAAWRPARKAARVSAIDCIRGSGEVKLEEKELRTSPVVEKLFGFEGLLAAKNLKRNSRNFRSTVTALSAGVILFISLGELSNSAAGIERFMDLGLVRSVIVEYTSATDRDVNAETGEKETTFLYPIDSEIGDTVKAELEKFGGVDIYAMGEDRERYTSRISVDMIMPQMLEQWDMDEEEPDQSGEREFPVELIVLDSEHYAELCREAGAPVGSTILLNDYWYNDNGNEVRIEPFSPQLDAVTLSLPDGSALDMEIGGVLTREQFPKELFYPNTQPLRLVVERFEVRGFTWYADTEDIPGFMEYADAVLAEAFPYAETGDYNEIGVNTRVYKTDDYMHVMNIAIVLGSVLMYSFAALLMLMGFTNVVSTISTNVRMRAREFAVLRSVGMTGDGIKRMLDLESILCAAKALMYGLPAGLVMSFLINLPIKAMFPVPYTLPWASVLLCIAVVFLSIWAVTRFAAAALRGQNIVETIRRES